MSSAADLHSAVPSRLGRLSTTERRVWQAFSCGDLVDLRVGDPEIDDPAEADSWPAYRTVRGVVIATLLLGACPGESGSVAALRLAGARITGEVEVGHGRVESLLLLQECRLDAPLRLDDAVTESIDLHGSKLNQIDATGAQIRGSLNLRETTFSSYSALNADGIRIEGSLVANHVRSQGMFSLINAQISGQLNLNDASLSADKATEVVRRNGEVATYWRDLVALNAGGMHVGRSLLACRLQTHGTVRLPGAHIGSSLSFDGARLDGNGAKALQADALVVASEASFRPSARHGAEQCFTAVGSVELPGARIGDNLWLSGASLTATPGQCALYGNRIQIEGNCNIDRGFQTEGEIRLTGARIVGVLDLHGMNSPQSLLALFAVNAVGGIRDTPDSWPNRVNLDGLTYGPFADYRPARERVQLITRQVRQSNPQETGAFRAQPYQQLAAYYRTLGSDVEARTILLKMQRMQRALLPRWRRVPGYLLDVLVGYGYRPLRAVGWAIGLLATSSTYFSTVRPDHISSEDHSTFNPVLYAANHLIPVFKFGQADVWQYHGIPEVLTSILSILGWTLGIAIAAAATRTFNRS